MVSFLKLSECLVLPTGFGLVSGDQQDNPPLRMTSTVKVEMLANFTKVYHGLVAKNFNKKLLYRKY